MDIVEILSKVAIPLVAAAMAGWAAYNSCASAKAADKAAEYSLQASKQMVYVNAITTERIKWLNNLKKMVAEYLVSINDYVVPNSELDVLESRAIRNEMLKLTRTIIFQLNPSAVSAECKLSNRLSELYVASLNWEKFMLNASNEEVAKASEKLTHALAKIDIEFQALFKVEWEIIKREAEGEKVDSQRIVDMRREYGSDDEFLNSELNIL